MKVIICAAGPILPGYGFPRNSKPICLYHYKGEVILERQVKILKSFGLHDIRLVIGYGRELIEKFVEGEELDIELAYNLGAVEARYVTAGWSKWFDTLRAGLEGVDDDIIIIMGDNYLSQDGIPKLLKDKHKCVILRNPHAFQIFKFAKEFLQELRELTGSGSARRLVNFMGLGPRKKEMEEKYWSGVAKAGEVEVIWSDDHDVDCYRQTDEGMGWALSHIGIDKKHWNGLSLKEKQGMLKSRGVKYETYYEEVLFQIEGYCGDGKNFDVYGVEFEV